MTETATRETKETFRYTIHHETNTIKIEVRKITTWPFKQEKWLMIYNGHCEAIQTACELIENHKNK